MDIMETIRDQVENNSVLLYMKGSPNQPQCGFSRAQCRRLWAAASALPMWIFCLTRKFAPICQPLATGLPSLSCGLPASLIGGCDIVTEMQEKGELKPLIDEAIGEEPAADKEPSAE